MSKGNPVREIIFVRWEGGDPLSSVVTFRRDTGGLFNDGRRGYGMFRKSITPSSYKRLTRALTNALAEGRIALQHVELFSDSALVRFSVAQPVWQKEWGTLIGSLLRGKEAV